MPRRDPYQAARQLLREASLELARLRRIRGAYLQTARRIAGARLRLALAAGLLGVPIAGAAGAVTPIFMSPFLIPVVELYPSPDFADIDGDGDGDLDAFVGESSGNIFFFENVPEPAGPMSLFSGILAVAALVRRRPARGSSGVPFMAVGAPHDLEIDSKPRSATNPVSPFSRGVIPVAILGSDDFDVNDVPP